MVYFLCTNPDNTAGGWCYSKRETLADDLGLTKQGILRMIDKLIEKGFIEKHPVTKFLKTTNAWNGVYFENVPSVNKVYPLGKQSLPELGKQSLPNNNNLDNNNDISKCSLKNFQNKLFTTWTKEDFKESINEARARRAETNHKQFSKEMLNAFFLHWTQPHKKGKLCFNQENKWDTYSRLTGWLSRER